MRPPLNPPLTSSLGGFVLSQLAQSTHPYPPHSYQKFCAMTTSSNGNIFRVTGPLCGEFTGPGEFPTQRPVTRSFDVFFDLRLNKRLSKQPRGWWFETQSWSLWRHGNAVWPPRLVFCTSRPIWGAAHEVSTSSETWSSQVKYSAVPL